jgi:AAA+ ATPase superfamily predicted ATPase
MKFFDRENERNRIIKALAGNKTRLIILYGRRRCGKSTLIKTIIRPGDLYFMAQQADEAVQRAQLATTIGEQIPGFDKLTYPDWESLFLQLNNLLRKTICICLDEFPYLVKSSPGLPSTIQKIVDTVTNRKFHILLCGSSQQMMQGFALDSSSPIYGRADEILKITPLEAGWLPDALNCSPVQAVSEFAVWGGVPRYWELRSEINSFKQAIIQLILDRHGILHEEPIRLFMDDMRESLQAYSLLSLVGNGSNKLYEIAGKLGKPSTQLSRPIDNLIQLGYLKREIPFGELEKNSKKGIYKIADPFMNFYFTFIVPHLSSLELGNTAPVYEIFKQKHDNFVSAEWENICRRSIPLKPVNGIMFNSAKRWWGNNLNKEVMEMDVIANSIDGKYLLVGECKWSVVPNIPGLIETLERKAALLPFAQGKKIIPALFLKGSHEKTKDRVFYPEDIMKRLQF